LTEKTKTKTKKKEKKSHRLYLELLGIVALCFVLSFLLFLFLSFFTVAAVEEYCFYQDIPLTEDQLYHLDTTVLAAALIVAVIFFAVLFFALFGERLSYIRAITRGIDALGRGNLASPVPLMGNNELTELARSVNRLAESEQEIKRKERELAEEKEELIRALSHDIRTPLTSLMSYTELLARNPSPTLEELTRYFDLVGAKTEQIKHLTDILLDSAKCQTEELEDASLLFIQLADELEELLEGDFRVSVDLSALPRFKGRFDVREMRRVFDNLISNVQKYADSAEPVILRVALDENGLVITQRNTPKAEPLRAEGYRMGILSIRRIAQNYGGSVSVTQTESCFEITLTLSDIC